MFKLSAHQFLYKGMAALLAFAFLLGATGVQIVRAASLTVTNTNDSGSGSLRQAIADAQFGDTITFDPSLAGGTITLTSGKLIIDKDLTITGPGPDKLAISGNQIFTVFEVGRENFLGEVTVTIQGLTIRNGFQDDSNPFCSSGGIDNQGTLTLNSLTFSDNSGYSGGGICNVYQLTVNNSTFNGNSAVFAGGGIHNRHSLTVNASTFHDNSADWGGGINNFSDATVNASTFRNNSGTTGGGISNYNQLMVNNSTFSDNSSDYGGSDIYNSQSSLTVNNSTFRGNTNPFGSIYGLISEIRFKNSVITHGPSGGNCFLDAVTFQVAGTNFGDDHTCRGFTQVTSTQLNLGSLADNGGPTQTFALLPGSIAIDAATDYTDYDGNPLTTDQRGVARPQGAACDVGAFELELQALFNFSGFFQPVDNLPTLNTVKAGQGVPVKFSLGGDQGLAIFAEGYPISQQIACEGGSPVDNIEQTVTAGGSSLSYNPATDTYTYVWKTQKAWSGTCRTLIVKLSDGTEHKANFKFK